MPISLFIARRYAAVVAGFTPAVLFLGPVNGTIEGAWLREQAQFLGVGIYLAIDNLIAPFRSDKALRLGASLPVLPITFYTIYSTCAPIS